MPLTTASARRHTHGRRGRLLLLPLLAAAVLLGQAAPASAAEGSIDHVQTNAHSVQVLFSIPGSTGATHPDLASVRASVNGKPAKATATLASKAPHAVRRTAILAIDVSKSMAAHGKFAAAKQAANAFLDAAPADLYVGIVTFAGTVHVAQTPSLDRAATRRAIAGLSLDLGTRLYEGVRTAAQVSGKAGQRSILVLSDGRDTSHTRLHDVTTAIQHDGARVDVVALSQSAADQALLDKLALAGHGTSVSADDPSKLQDLFAGEAEQLAQQLLVTVIPPAGVTASEGSLAVSVAADGQSYADRAYVRLRRSDATTAGPSPTALQPARPTGFRATRTEMLAGLGAAALGVLLLALGAFGLLERRRPASVEDRVGAYSRDRSARRAARRQAEAATPQRMSTQALGMAEKALARNKNLADKVGDRLEAAGMSLKPAEWLLLHAGLAFGAGVVFLLLGGGNALYLVVGLVLGSIGPWVYLGLKQSRRLKAFKGQLADTLQLMSGSLSAGMSLAQSVDTVVREGADPIAGEFRRAIVESRLGVELEDSLEEIADRMQSRDFAWVVMAIRIQRQVGGNLAELLNTVAATIREREYLERQVLALSAEGRLSVWLLGALPPGFMAYLLMANPTYLHPLFSSMIGWVLLGVMAVLLTVGIFWMKKLVKVNV